SFSIDDFLERFAEEERSAETRLAFFSWVERNVKDIPPRSWKIIRDLEIWPDSGGRPGPLALLCRPRAATVARILEGCLRMPSKRLLPMVGPLKRRGLSLPVRATPAPEELQAWIDSATEGLPVDRPLDAADVRRLRAFEVDLATLSTDRRVGEAL